MLPDQRLPRYVLLIHRLGTLLFSRFRTQYLRKLFPALGLQPQCYSRRRAGRLCHVCRGDVYCNVTGRILCPVATIIWAPVVSLSCHATDKVRKAPFHVEICLVDAPLQTILLPSGLIWLAERDVTAEVEGEG